MPATHLEGIDELPDGGLDAAACGGQDVLGLLHGRVALLPVGAAQGPRQASVHLGPDVRPAGSHNAGMTEPACTARLAVEWVYPLRI